MWETIKGWFARLGTFSLQHLLPALTIAVIGILAIRLLVRIVTRALEKSKLEKTAHSLVVSLLQVVLYVVLGLIAASALGIDVSSIVALTSVLTLAVSLALQDILTNIIGGFMLLQTKPFKDGDYVEINGLSGTVKDIGLTYTKLATPDNKTVSIPNSAVNANQIINYTESGSRRVDFSVSAAYTAPSDRVIAALTEAGTIDKVLDSPAPPFAAIRDYGESAIVYTLQVWTASDDYWPALFEINRRIGEIFRRESLEMTYPHLNVHLDK